MNEEYQPMDTQIFNLKLSVYANSAYILACSLVVDGVPPSLQNLTESWNADVSLLTGAIKELLEWNVLETRPGPDGLTRYLPNPASLWHIPVIGENS